MRITVHNSFAPSLGVLRMISAFWASLVPYVRLALLLPRVHRLLAVVLALGVLLGTALPLAITIAIGQLAASVPEAIAGGSGSEAARTACRSRMASRAPTPEGTRLIGAFPRAGTDGSPA